MKSQSPDRRNCRMNKDVGVAVAVLLAIMLIGTTACSSQGAPGSYDIANDPAWREFDQILKKDYPAEYKRLHAIPNNSRSVEQARQQGGEFTERFMNENYGYALNAPDNQLFDVVIRLRDNADTLKDIDADLCAGRTSTNNLDSRPALRNSAEMLVAVARAAKAGRDAPVRRRLADDKDYADLIALTQPESMKAVLQNQLYVTPRAPTTGAEQCAIHVAILHAASKMPHDQAARIMNGDGTGSAFAP